MTLGPAFLPTVDGKGQGERPPFPLPHHYMAYSDRTNSPMFTTLSPAHAQLPQLRPAPLCFLSEVQSPLSQVLKLTKGGTSSSALRHLEV